MKSGDFDQDGRLDLFFTNGAARDFADADRPPLTHEMLVGKTRWDAFESATPERNEQNLAFRNLGGLGYQEVSREWGLDHVGMNYTCAQGDLDGDGDLDLVLSSLNEPVCIYRNDGPKGNAIEVGLLGTASNRFGLGSTVRIKTAQGEQVRQLYSGGGFKAEDDLLIHFGLGTAQRVDELKVEWPSGIVQTYQFAHSVPFQYHRGGGTSAQTRFSAGSQNLVRGE